MEFSECDFSNKLCVILRWIWSLGIALFIYTLPLEKQGAEGPSVHQSLLYWLSGIIQEAGKIASIDLPANTPFFSYNYNFLPVVAPVGARGRMQACAWLPRSLGSNSAPSIYQMAKVGDHTLYDALDYFPPKHYIVDACMKTSVYTCACG